MDDNFQTVIINLNDSTFAHSFQDGNRIHQYEFLKAKTLIEKQKESLLNQKRQENPCAWLSRFHNTISVFGGRGTGKTSFIYSLLDEFSHDKDIAVLRIIDPTLIEEKGHIFVLIVSLINEKIEEYLNTNEIKFGNKVYEDRKRWNACLLKLSRGLPYLDSVGGRKLSNDWQDDAFIMERGLLDVASAFHLEENFHNLISNALDILGKKCFMLAFDDIDIDMKKGWSVLETIRKYLTSNRLICLLSGNMQLYSYNVRLNQWLQLEKLKSFEPKNHYEEQVDELEGQYILKILKPENRIYLKSIYEATEYIKKTKYFVLYNDNRIELENSYTTILNMWGIVGKREQDSFRHFLLRLPARSQINILRTNLAESDPLERVNAFVTRMQAKDINVELAVNNTRLYSGIIASYLLNNDLLRDSYLLLPTTDDETSNCCLAGLGILFANNVKQNPFLIFDYLIKVGYLRNASLYLVERQSIQNLVKYGGYSTSISLKNCVGLTMAYLIGSQYNMAEHINIYALEKTAKKGDKTKIDSILLRDDVNAAQRCLGYIPLCSLDWRTNNNSEKYYSVYLLLAAIGQLVGNSGEIARTLKDVQLYRSYPIPDTDKSAADTEVLDDVQNPEFAMDDEPFRDLISMIEQWNALWESDSLPPYKLGRIMTRFYSAVKVISMDSLGSQMHRSLVAFLNASLIEEIGIEFSELNTNNAINDDKIFINNLKKVLGREGAADCIKLTLWLIKCPLLRCFMDLNIYNGIENPAIDVPYVDENRFNLIALLNQIKIKNKKSSTFDLPKFSGSANGIENTLKCIRLKAPDFDLEVSVINVDIDTAISNLNDLRIFQKISKNSVDAFRKNYRQAAD
jgi:hypothetical protein